MRTRSYAYTLSSENSSSTTRTLFSADTLFGLDLWLSHSDFTLTLTLTLAFTLAFNDHISVE
jgi:hypothetical protein